MKRSIGKLALGAMMLTVPRTTWSSSTEVPSAAARSAEMEGLAAAREKRFADAVRYFEQARNLAPHWADNLYYLGAAEDGLPGHELRAAAWLNAYLALEPKSPKAEDIRRRIALLEQKARERARQLVSKMREMAAQFPEGQVDAEKATRALFSEELALLEVSEQGPHVELGPEEPPADSTHAYDFAERLARSGASKEHLAERFADFGRLDLAERISGRSWTDFYPNMIEGRYLVQLSARTIIDARGILDELVNQGKFSLSTICEGAVVSAEQYLAYGNREYAMPILDPCILQAQRTEMSERGSPTPYLSDIAHYFLEVGNSKAAWTIQYWIDDVPHWGYALKACIQLDEAAWKKDQAQQLKYAKDYQESISHLRRSRRAAAGLGIPHALPTGDAYQDRLTDEQLVPWEETRPPRDFVDEMIDGRPGPHLYPNDAVDQWSRIVEKHLSDPLFTDSLLATHEALVQTIRSQTSSDVIDKAGAIFNSATKSAAILLDGLTAVTTARRTLLVRTLPSGKDVCQQLPKSK